jgi:hypothetical protein
MFVTLNCFQIFSNALVDIFMRFEGFYVIKFRVIHPTAKKKSYITRTPLPQRYSLNSILRCNSNAYCALFFLVTSLYI